MFFIILIHSLPVPLFQGSRDLGNWERTFFYIFHQPGGVLILHLTIIPFSHLGQRVGSLPVSVLYTS